MPDVLPAIVQTGDMNEGKLHDGGGGRAVEEKHLVVVGVLMASVVGVLVDECNRWKGHKAEVWRGTGKLTFDDGG